MTNDTSTTTTTTASSAAINAAKDKADGTSNANHVCYANICHILRSAMQRYGLHILVGIISTTLIYLILSPSRPTSTIYADNTLVRSVIFFRHGDRGPVATYPNDPHPFTDRKKWPSGTDGLTKKGKRDAYTLGKVFRRRYKNFLPDVYDSSDVIGYSTTKERTLATAALVFAGLYPPTAEEKWSEDVPWHPIPVYPDQIFNSSNGINCPRFEEEVMKLFASRNESFIKDYEQLLVYLSHHTGLNMLTDPFIYVTLVGDSLNMQKKCGFKLPDWANEVFPHKMMPLVEEFYNMYAIGTETQVKLAGGPVVKRMLDIFKLGKRKLYLNSCHDVTLMSLQGALGVPKPLTIPQPTGAILVELHNQSGRDIVKAYFLQHSRQGVFHPLPMSCGHTNECVFEDFETMALNYTAEDYNKLCNHVTNLYQRNHTILKAIGTPSIPSY